MNRPVALFIALIVIGPLHMVEQMLTGIEEYYGIRHAVQAYLGWFDPSHADLAVVGLITVVWTIVSLLLLAALVGGRGRTLVLLLFGVFAVTELHHVVEAVLKGAYDPGLVTSIPYAVVCGLLIRAAWAERPRAGAGTSKARAAAAPSAQIAASA